VGRPLDSCITYCFNLFTSAGGANRASLGLPTWFRIWFWITSSFLPAKVAEDPAIQKPRKNPDIPILEDYSKDPGPRFWSKFPFRPLPTSPSSCLDADALEDLLLQNRQLLKDSELLRGEKAVSFIREGAPSHQSSELPGITCKNASSAMKYGEALTDTIAEWVKEGFVAGPFVSPPVPNFRSNSLMMVPQKDKIRPVLNVSYPQGESLNDNIDPLGPEKVYMSSARLFSYSILESGLRSVMSKFDIKSAYKNIPCMLKDLALQGFTWCGRFFIDISQIFGAIAAVSNFDIPGNTCKTLAQATSSIPRSLVHRQLDDVPFVAPERLSWCQEFGEIYESVCEKVGMPLAEECPHKEKAFKLSRTGRVLGIEFDSYNLLWRLPLDKRNTYLNSTLEILQAEFCSIEQLDSLLGRLNFVCSMIPFMRTFKRNIQQLHCTLEESGEASGVVPDEAAVDLRIWARFFHDNSNWIPICHRPSHPPLVHKTFTTDAAGWSKDDSVSKVGSGCIGLDEDGIPCLAFQYFWQVKERSSFVDCSGKFLGSKTTFLEFVGVLIPFLLIPDKLCNQHVVVRVDNIGCIYAWENGYCNSDMLTSILVRCLVLISARISCIVHVLHSPRCSTWESNLADRLSRERTTLPSDLRLVQSFLPLDLPSTFKSWLQQPNEDWTLPIRLLEDLSNSFPCLLSY